MHQNQIIFRDLKLENVLLSSTGHVKLCDFGLSCITNRDITRKTGCGTFSYFSPELIKQSSYTNKIDVWCLGIEIPLLQKVGQKLLTEIPLLQKVGQKLLTEMIQDVKSNLTNINIESINENMRFELIHDISCLNLLILSYDN